MKTRSRYGIAVVVLLAGILGMAGCEPGGAEKAGKKIDQAAEKAGDKVEDAKEAVGEKASQAGDYMDDSGLTAKIKAQILRDPLLKVFQIHVSTTNGAVTLSGTVDSQQAIDGALALVRGNQNVKSVQNNLVLK